MPSRTLTVQITGDAKSLSRTLKGSEKDLGSFEKSGRKTFRALGTAAKVGGLAIAGGLAVGSKAAIEAASNIDESLSKNRELFGSHAKAIESWSRTTAASMGIAREESLEATGTFGNLFTALEIGPKKSAGMSKALVELAADMASFNNATPEEALEALRSGLVGETEPLRKFGVNLNDATLRTEALRMGLVKNTKEALDPQTKALAVNSLLFQQTEKAQGDFARTSDGAANQTRILKAEMSDLTAEAGEALLPAVKSVVSTTVDLVQGFRDGTGAGGALAGIFRRVRDTAVGTFEGIRGLVEGFRAGEGPARDLAAGLGAVVGSFVAFRVIGTVVAGVTALKGAFSGLSGVILKNPLGLAAVAVAGLASAFGILSVRTKNTTGDARAFNDALRAQADALRAVRDIDIDVAQRRANVKSANVAVEQAQKQYTAAVKEHGKKSIEARQAEADLTQAKVAQKRANRELSRTEEDSTRKKEEAQEATRKLTDEERKLNSSVDAAINKNEKHINALDKAIERQKELGGNTKATRENVAALEDKQRDLRNEINRLKSKKVDVEVDFKLSPAAGSSWGRSGDGTGVTASVGKLAHRFVSGGNFLLPGGGNLGGFASGLMGADPDLGPFAAIGRRFGLGVSSGIRPGDTTLSGNVSYHSSGDAIDMSGSFAGMRRFAATLFRGAGSQLRELISPFPELGIKDGRPFRYSSAIQAQHSGDRAHVHVAYTGPFGDGIGQATSAARAAGFRGRDLVTAVAVAGPESGYRNSARLVTSAEDSRGMWQINTYAHPWARGLNLENPQVAARAAYRVWREAGGFGPWTAFSSGSYRSYLDEARDAVKGSRRRGGRGGGVSAPTRGKSKGTLVGGVNEGKGTSGISGSPVGQTHEEQLAGVDVAKAQAERDDNLNALIKALRDERRIKRRRLKQVNRRLRRRKRLGRSLGPLLQEKAALIRDLDEIQDTLREYKADVAGGATTISGADELDAGVAAGGGGGAVSDAPTAEDFIARDLALAGLTEGTADDIAATKRLVALRRRELAAARRTADPRDDIDAARNLRSALDALENLTQTMAHTNRLAEQDRALRQEEVANQRALIALSKRGDALMAAVIAAVNGGIGGTVGLGTQSAGVPGQLARM